MFEIGEVRRLFRRAPIAYWVALFSSLLFALPLPLELHAVRVARLRVEGPGREPIVFTGLDLRADYEPGRLRVELSMISWNTSSPEKPLASVFSTNRSQVIIFSLAFRCAAASRSAINVRAHCRNSLRVSNIR